MTYNGKENYSIAQRSFGILQGGLSPIPLALQASLPPAIS